jgi:hypothetical protein
MEGKKLIGPRAALRGRGYLGGTMRSEAGK